MRDRDLHLVYYDHSSHQKCTQSIKTWLMLVTLSEALYLQTRADISAHHGLLLESIPTTRNAKKVRVNN